MHPRTLFRIITITQNILLAVSILLLVLLPPFIALSDSMTPSLRDILFEISHVAVAFVMLIRPLANLFPRRRLLAQLVILRKGFGVLSASIILAFAIAQVVLQGGAYFAQFLTLSYWSLKNYALLAHLGDVTAFILLITSNNFSKRILGRNWKRVQKLAYIYFYAGTGYAALAFHNTLAITILTLVTIVLFLAFIKNHRK